MNSKRIIKAICFILIMAGAIILIKEIGSTQKNYYLQSAGLISLMLGLFVLNSKLVSRFEKVGREALEEEE